ncbi:hypothetical protein HYT84_00395 [Candidatus Micrarchaeota archaeon]|nr:hypothetical protein [Candidatus Micrarchaeota archaeon]
MSVIETRPRGYAEKTVARFPKDREDINKGDRFHPRVRAHIQTLAKSAEPQIDRLKQLWIPEESGERPTAVFDLLGFHPDLRSRIDVDTSIDTSTELCGLKLRLPLEFGDMSAGALHPNLNLALAFAALEAEIVCGTGEGGLLPELYGQPRIFVQWASARWGVTEESIVQGAATILKAGQGAKAIGGELPEQKLRLEIIRKLRKFSGADAISPAVHKDVYSIEDLGKVLSFLKLLREAAKAPPFVGVKIIPGKKAGAVACGIGRMGGNLIQLDGKKAGTGATPKVVADNMGFDIEFAAPMVDHMLRCETDTETGLPLRERVKLVGGGGITSARDLAIALALGLDATFVGTAAMIAAGCVKADVCAAGDKCPAAETNLLLAKAIDINWAKQNLINWVIGVQRELQAILKALGLTDVKHLVGRRDLLYANSSLSIASTERLGVTRRRESTAVYYESNSTYWPWREEDQKFWPVWRKEHVAHLAKEGLPFKRSMGSQGPPFVTLPHTITDHLTIDVAQITNPQGDGYRQPIGSRVFLGSRGQMRVVDPILLGKPKDEHLLQFAVAARRTGSLFILSEAQSKSISAKTLEKAGLVELEDPSTKISNTAGVILPDIINGSISKVDLSSIITIHHANGVKLVTVRLSSEDSNLTNKVDYYARAGADAIIISGELSLNNSSIELAVRRVHKALTDKKYSDGKTTLRQQCSVLAECSNVRDAADVIKLQALGADAVFVRDVAELAMESGSKDTDSLVNWKRGSRSEMKLVMGGDGLMNMTSVVGNVDILSTVNLPNNLQKQIDVEPEGMKIVRKKAAK